MKSLKLVIVNALTLIIGLGLLSGSVSYRSAEAARIETIPRLQVNRLGNFRGQYLTVLYAVGASPFISTEPSQINVTQVKTAKSIQILQDSAIFPKVEVEKEGFRPSYNMIIFVVSRQPDYSWINADGSIPDGMVKTSNHMSSHIAKINKTDVEKFLSTNSVEGLLHVNLVH